MITKMWWGNGEFENVLYGQLKLIVSPGYIKHGIVSVIGDKIVLYIQNNIRLGISSRGVGSLKQINGDDVVQDDYELIGFDLVWTPSTPGAYLFPPKKGDFNINTNNNQSIDKSFLPASASHGWPFYDAVSDGGANVGWTWPYDGY
jgi:hypothetical protein